MCDRVVERALAAALTEANREAAQLRADLDAVRLQLAAESTAFPHISPGNTWEAWSIAAARARALLTVARTPLIHLPHPRSPEDDREPRRRHPHLPPLSG